MNLKLTHYIGLVLTVLLLAVFGAFLFGSQQASGSVSVTDEYFATSTTATVAGKHLKTTGGTGLCALGSVVVASSSATTFTLWNATSTTDISSTTIATFVADLPEGTYTLDVNCNRGLVLDTPVGFNGYFVTTYR